MQKLKAILFITILSLAMFPAQQIPDKLPEKLREKETPIETIESLSQKLTSMGIDNVHNGHVM